MGIIVGFDYGRARIGLAVSSESKTIAFAHSVYKRVGGKADGQFCAEFAKSQNAECCVVGLPLNLDGTESESSKGARILAHEIAKYAKIPVVFVNEGLTTVEAYDKLREMGKTEREAKGSIDSFAAEIILQEYLDSLN